ncbi:MAG: leucine-rich repeat domain-containing protein, partial [Clostridia bacterium]|nr:leucine-rich repeat domain-containing protein [Clostridia bacterium]
SFKIDLTVDCFENSIPAEDRIQTPSISILKITYPRDAEPVEEWIVRAGASTNANYTFAGNTLTFTPENEASFELIVCLDENDYNFVTFNAPEDKKMVEYAVFGNGIVAVEDWVDIALCKNRGKAVLADSAESVVFTITTEDCFEEFSIDGRHYRVDELPRDGITYNTETKQITIPLEGDHNRYYIDFNFSGGEPYAPREFQVVYNPDRFDVVCTNGEGSFDLYDHGRSEYPEDMMSPPYITVNPKDGHYCKGVLVFTNSGEDYCLNSLEDGNKFTFVNTDINCVQLIADDDVGINEYSVRYDTDITKVAYGSTLIPDKEYTFTKNVEMSFNTYGIDPYRVLVRIGADRTEDITALYSNGVLKYTPTDNFPRTFEFYFTKAEYDCATMNPDPERNIVELMTWGGGNIEILSANGAPVPAENIAKYNNRYRIALNNTDTTLKIKLNPFTGQTVETVRIDGADQPAESYTGNVLNLEVPQNRGFVNSEIVFTKNENATSGAFGDNLFWEYNDTTKTLTVKGTGKIPDYYTGGVFSQLNRPWENYRTAVKHIVIEEGVTFIGSAAFHGMSYVETIDIPSTALTINPFAFQSLYKVETLNIPEGVITISQQAFQDMASLKTVTFPSTLRKIVSTTFQGAASLESITVAEGNPVFHSTGNCLIETKERKIVLGCTKSVIPTDGSVVSLGDSSFYGSSIKNITIPKQITTIGNHAFTYSGLTEIVIPDSIDT